MTRVKRSIFRKPYAVKFEIRESGKKIGWAYLYIVFQDRHREPYGFIENIYVAPDYRNRGLGSMIVRRVIVEAKKRKCYKLIGTSREANTAAHRFYRRLGFRKMGYEFRMDLRDSRPLQRE